MVYKYPLSEFVQEGWRREQQLDSVPKSWLKADDFDALLWKPQLSEDKFFYLDNESIDLRPGTYQISLLPEKLVFFCSPELRQEVKQEQEKGPKKWYQSSKVKFALNK